MQRSRLGFGAREAAWIALAVGYGLMLKESLPGHMSVDSVIELHEGRFHLRENWGPAIYPWILGLFDRVSPGTTLYVIVTALMLYGSWALLPLLRGRASWWLAPLAAGIVLTPQAIIYQGIVWHDVLFANAAVLGFLCLGFAARDWGGGRPPWLRLAASVLLLSVAGLVRQNGAIFLPIAALTVGWIGWDEGWRRALAWGLGWFAAAGVATAVLSVTALPQGPGLEQAHAQGFRALAAYDLMGALKRDPKLELPRIEHESRAAAQTVRTMGPAYYSPRRIDFVDGSPQLTETLKNLSTESLLGDWTDLIVHRPDLYLPVRAEVFRWVFATPVIDACLPVYLGIDGPEKQLKELGLQQVWEDEDQRLFNYATWFYDTPVLSHVAFAAVALVIIAILLLRRDPADKAIGGLLVGGLAFTATFLPLSLACDYRYLYVLDVAVLTGLLYLAADPRLRRRPLAERARGPEKRSTQA
jgi:hypothetical protein